MKTNQIFAITALLLSSLAISHAAQFFDSGNLVVLQVGNGSASLTSAGTAIYLDQYTTSGSLVNDLAIPSTGSSALVNSGTASSEGQLSLSANGQYLVFAGYNVAAGTTKVASSLLQRRSTWHRLGGCKWKLYACRYNRRFLQRQQHARRRK